MTSTWTRKVAAPIAAVAVGALFAAGASSASAATLTVKQARSLAHKLVQQQKQQRSLVYVQLGDPVRKSSSKIVFSYRDRSTSNVLCTARIVAVATSSGRRADLRNSRCHGIPSDVLGYEAASRKLAHAVSGTLGAKVRKSRTHYRNAVKNCASVNVPQSHRGQVKLLFKAAGAWAFYSPLRSRLGDFTNELHGVDTADPELTDGLKAWDRVLVLFDSLPAATAHPCAALKTWAANGYSSGSAPADFDELQVEMDGFATESRTLDGTAKYLDHAGVFPGPARAFAPAGLLALALNK